MSLDGQKLLCYHSTYDSEPVCVSAVCLIPGSWNGRSQPDAEWLQRKE